MLTVPGAAARLSLRQERMVMALSHAKSGDLVNIQDAAAEFSSNTSVTLVRDDHIEIFRLVLGAGTHMQEHSAAGAMTVQCLGGEVDFSCHDKTQTLRPGDLIYLNDAAPHALHSKQGTILLITLMLHRK
ncbi:AraC family ligand binding domain-containing protein [Candidatus Accumulibacter sp. ACC012]|jgi:quercetin dioxygenase-like cupin family protein|uniref:AraC family ligand binding domain-containing protein n=1 Tax=Candidatus Accumulibacter sp. ACC012 TaxID=2823332 RepID=UPI0025BF293E|nr:AraC family ligand binding domain-containing protein [Candidatus Accumulibacter sp. ACC012]